MLAEAISEMSGEAPRIEKGVSIDARVDAYVPADYVESEAIKIDIHRRIALARNEHVLEEIVEELTDRFGELPDAVSNLIQLSELRLRMERLGADRLTITRDRVMLAPIDLDQDQAARLRSVEPLAAYSSSKTELQVRLPDPAAGIERARIMLDHVLSAVED
jgi:transcription-repair coupling factor (superfamily II helicase)